MGKKPHERTKPTHVQLLVHTSEVAEQKPTGSTCVEYSVMVSLRSEAPYGEPGQCTKAVATIEENIAPITATVAGYGKSSV